MISNLHLQFATDSLDAEAGVADFAKDVGLELSAHRWSAVSRFAVLIATDLIAVTISAATALTVWIVPVLHQPVQFYLRLAPLIAVFPFAYLVGGLYPGFGLGAVETIRRLTQCTCVSFLLLMGASFLLKSDGVSRFGLAISWALTIGVVPLMRYLVLSVASDFYWWHEPCVLAGSIDQIRLTISSLRDAHSLGYRVVGYISPEPLPRENLLSDVRRLGNFRLAERLAQLGITTLLLWDSPEAVRLLDSVQRLFRHVVVIRDEKFLPVEHARTRNLGGVLGIEFTNELLRARNQLVKRSTDIVAGVLILLLTLPVTAIAALAVKLVSPGPAFYRQRRIGRDGREFLIWKIRTMHVDAEDRLKDCLASSPGLLREWQRNMKLANDPRIIPGIGHLLRRLSIDELPQLVNVITGEMSLVGPRPFPDYHLKAFSREFCTLRSAVRPGMTGMWQVTVRSAGGLDQQERLDAYYIRNWSLWLDVYLLVRTLFAVMAANRAS